MSLSRIFFLIPPKVHLLDITGPAHIFYELKEMKKDIHLHFIRISDKTEVSSSAGLFLSQLEDYSDFVLTEQDVIFLPGLEKDVLLDTGFLASSYPFFNWLQEQNKQGAIICSVCTGAFLLAEVGLLDGKSCTTHWKFLGLFKKRYPGIEALDNRLFVKDKNIYTSAGVSSGIDLALQLINDRLGAKVAAAIAKEVVVYLRRAMDDPQLSVFLQYRNHLDSGVHEVQDYLAQNLQGDCSLVTVSALINMSPRNLSRRFKQHTGLTLGAYLTQLRKEKAQTLLDLGEKTSAVANQVGLKSTNQLRTLLNK